MDRPSGVRMAATSGSEPRTPVSYLKRKVPDNGMQSDLLKLLEDLGTDSPIKPMEDYGLPSVRPSSLTQYDLPTNDLPTSSDTYPSDARSSPMERRASEGMAGEQSSIRARVRKERETPSPSYLHVQTLSNHGRGPTPPSGSSLSSLNSRYSASTQRSTGSNGLTDSATLNSLSSLAITPEYMNDDDKGSGSSKNSSSRYVPSSGRAFNRTVSAPIQMGASTQSIRDEYEELSLTNRRKAELHKSTQESARERSSRQPLSHDYGAAAPPSEQPTLDSHKTPALRRRVMDAAVQGSTGGKRFAMKAQRPVRDGQGVSAASDSADVEDGTEPSPRYYAEGSSSSHILPESTSRQSSPRLRNHAIPSTIHEEIREKADGPYSRRSTSPEVKNDVPFPPTIGTARQGHSRNDSPPHAGNTSRRDAPNPHRFESARQSPDRSGNPLQLGVNNKENRNPYSTVEEGKEELTSSDSKTWVQPKSLGRAPQNEYSAEASVNTGLGPTYSNDPRGVSAEGQYGDRTALATHQGDQWHPAATLNATELPLITPTIGRSMSSADRRPDEPLLPHQLPPFVAYDAYQQAMTPMANGYPQMQPLPQAPPTVSQLPAGRKAFTVNNKEYERLGILGRGGSSKVYSVLCPTKRTVMALKRVALERCDQETITNYMNEVALLNRLRGHDRIIQLMECQVLRSGSGRPKTLQMLMECGETDFSSLLDEQRGKPLNMSFVLLYWQQMLEAVQAVHEQKVVHSDLKPANFVLVKGRLKIIDFGIAKAIANDTVNIQRDVQIGTVNYMSPEAVHKMKGQSVYKLSYPSDVWSLGCILYQMIYGNPPFHGVTGGAMVKMQVIGSGQHVIEFPERAVTKIIDAKDGRMVHTQHVSIPYSARHTMRSCLSYQKDNRLTIPELLSHNFLKSGHDSVPDLSDDQILMTQSQMRRLVDHVLREAQAGKDVGEWRQQVTSLMFNELRSQYETAFGNGRA